MGEGKQGMSEHPFDDERPVTVSMGVLYALICGSAIASKTFYGGSAARQSTLMVLSVVVPEAKRAMLSAGWQHDW